MPTDALLETLRQAQRFGFFGDGDMAAAAAHSEAFVAAIGELLPGARVLDLGSGGGLPGLVLAESFPDATVVLLDRRQKRTDFLERAVRRLGWQHVIVRAGDVRELIADVATGVVEPFDVVTARGFGPPAFTLRSAANVIRSNGLIVISEPPAGDRWPPDLVAELELVGEPAGSVRRFRRTLTT